jgi:hypothetical protein
MKRREFIKLLGGTVAFWPLPARAQQSPEVIPRVGFVYPGSKEAAASRIDAIMSGLRVSGYAGLHRSNLWRELRRAIRLESPHWSEK